MDYSEFRRHLGKAGFTVNLFASYLGVKSSSVSNYAKVGKVPRAYSLIAVLLGDYADRKIDSQDVLNRFDIQPVGSEPTADDNVHQIARFRNTRKSRSKFP